MKEKISLIPAWIVIILLPLYLPSTVGIDTASDPLYPLVSEGSFIENLGQWDEGLSFVSDTDFGRMGFGEGKVFIDIHSEDGGNIIKYDFLGSKAVRPTGIGSTPQINNYFIGPLRVSGARTFNEILYPDLWDGIDLRYYFSDVSPKYEFIVHPGGDPDMIAVSVQGYETLTASGDALMIGCGDHLISDSGLTTFQSDPAIDIGSDFLLRSEGVFGFEIDDYDRSRDLVIDPEITYSAQIGGTSSEYGVDMVVDESGYIYVLGRTESTDFPVTVGSYSQSLGGSNDLFIIKLDPTGSDILSATYWGGTSGEDYARCGIAIGIDGNIIIAGDTRSSDLPTTSGTYMPTYSGAGDMYVAGLDPDLKTLVFSTFLGAHETEYFGSLAVTQDGSIYITGGTESTDYPTTSNAYDSVKGESSSGSEDWVVSRLDKDGKYLLNSTYIGGNGDERGLSIRIDQEGSIYVGGWTEAPDFPTTVDAYDRTHNGQKDCAVCILDPDLKGLKYSTFFGGTENEGGDDNGMGMEVSSSGIIYIGGQTLSTDLPTGAGSYQQSKALGASSDSFAAAIQGSSLLYSTYLGGSEGEFTLGLALDYQENVIITGATASYDHPLTLDAQDSSFNGGGFAGDCVFSILSPDLGSLYYSTFYGGTSEDLLYKVISTTYGSLYFCGATGSSDIPVSHDHGAPLNANGNALVLMSGGFSSRDPLEVYSLGLYSDSDFTMVTSLRDRGEPVYIQITGLDSNSTTRDGTKVNLTFGKGSYQNVSVWLRETDVSTGMYRGFFKIPAITEFYENITVYSSVDSSKRKVFTVDTPVRLNSAPLSIDLIEHEGFHLLFQNLGWYSSPTWSFWTDADWIDFDLQSLNVSGLPTNPDVGRFTITLNVSDGMGHLDERTIKVKVDNIPPVMSGDDILTVIQDQEYISDHSSDEDGEEGIYWTYSSDARWLSLDPYNGTLKGTPGQAEVGIWRVQLIVRDGNGGSDSRVMDISVIDKNDRPVIVTDDVTKVDQGAPFKRDYEVEDIDPGDVHTWSLTTDAAWLKMDGSKGVLSGTPGPNDVGNWTVNINVTDSGGLSDDREFVLEVVNINDRPFFVDIPQDTNIMSGSMFRFDVNASDPDTGTDLEYTVKTTPRTDMRIDDNMGALEWEATLNVFETTPYILYVEVSVSDGELSMTHEFELTIIKTGPPTSTLITPENRRRVSAKGLELVWDGTDPEGDQITYDLYVGDNQGSVQLKKVETRYIADYPGTAIEVAGLATGKTYFWTVIPFDGASYGQCQNNIFSFIVNSPPVVDTVGVKKVEVGQKFELLISVTDQDEADRTGLRFKLDGSPEGMTIGVDTGYLEWKPADDQVMLHRVVVNISDGIDQTTLSFIVEVVEAKTTSGNTLWVIVIPIVLVLVLLAIGAGIFLWVRSRKKDESEEETVIGTIHEDEDLKVGPAAKTEVAISVTEAHASLGKGSKKVSYEDLYGMPAPEQEEGMTTRELRDYISSQIDDLKKVEE
ncbi:MAG: putative Ig domain-containing protein [Candidatus Thermoplasmatota archaeon]|nr:putative Ig domain-containing protein [Candidatus Thermoplasmatota archaeon]